MTVAASLAPSPVLRSGGSSIAARRQRHRRDVQRRADIFSSILPTDRGATTASGRNFNIRNSLSHDSHQQQQQQQKRRDAIRLGRRRMERNVHVATAAISLLIYNNWSYVRERLLSATVEYEETGWYDGQVRVYFHYRVYFNARMGNVIDVVFYLP